VSTEKIRYKTNLHFHDFDVIYTTP